MATFNLIWMIYVSATISFYSLEIFARQPFQCYEGKPGEWKTSVNNARACVVMVDTQRLQNFYWDLFLEKQLEVNQTEPSDSVEVPAAEFVSANYYTFLGDRFDDSQQSIPFCEEPNDIHIKCYCFTNLCNADIKIPATFIRKGGNREVKCGWSRDTNCQMNQLCTLRVDVHAVQEAIQARNDKFRIIPETIIAENRISSGCTNDTDPKLLLHSKSDCIFDGDATNPSVMTCRCNSDQCHHYPDFLTDDLMAFPKHPKDHASRIRCVSSVSTLDETIVWCEPHEVCTVRVNLIRKKVLNQLFEDDKSNPTIYQGCYNLNSNAQESIIVIKDDEECRNVDLNLTSEWRCVCTTQLCNWYLHSKLTNTLPRTKNKKGLYCYNQQHKDGEVDLTIMEVPGDHVCSVYLSGASIAKLYRNFATQTKLNESEAGLEEPLKINKESIIYQNSTSAFQLTKPLKVNQVCSFVFAKKENNDKILVCVCNASLCNGMESVKLMPNDLRQDVPQNAITTTTGEPPSLGCAKKIFPLWIILLVHMLLEV